MWERGGELNLKTLRTRQKRTGTQGHCRRFRVWRWERALEQGCEAVAGTKDWAEAAQDKEAWEKLVPRMALWRCEHYNS